MGWAMSWCMTACVRVFAFITDIPLRQARHIYTRSALPCFACIIHDSINSTNVTHHIYTHTLTDYTTQGTYALDVELFAARRRRTCIYIYICVCLHVIFAVKGSCAFASDAHVPHMHMHCYAGIMPRGIFPAQTHMERTRFCIRFNRLSIILHIVCAVHRCSTRSRLCVRPCVCVCAFTFDLCPFRQCSSVPVASVRKYNPLSSQCASRNTCTRNGSTSN